MEILDLVKRTLPVASAAAQFANKIIKPLDSVPAARGSDSTESSPTYSDANLTHYATVETDHPYKQAVVSHFRVSGM